MITRKQQLTQQKNSLQKLVKNTFNTQQKAKNGLAWFFNQLKSSVSSVKSKANYDPIKDPFIGGMFCFLYDPKLKEVLPYWDRFPLVIPIELYSDGFLGLNLHYISPIMRAKLLDALITLRSRNSSNEVYMKVSYSILKNLLQSELFKPCIKRYLSTNIISKNITKIDSSEWENIIFFPVQQFKKESAQKIWRKNG